MKSEFKFMKSELGAALIETVLVFPLFFAICWATLGYALPFFMLQTMHYASEEAIREAVRADPLQGSIAYHSKLISLATNKSQEVLDILPDRMKSLITNQVAIEVHAGIPTLVVRLIYPEYAQNPIIPIIILPGVGPIPNLSGDLVTESRYRLESSS